MLEIKKLMKERLSALNYTSLDIIDLGEEHVHHTHANQGHFLVKITSPSFKGKSLVEQHQMVYETLGDVMQKIHALRIQTITSS